MAGRRREAWRETRPEVRDVVEPLLLAGRVAPGTLELMVVTKRLLDRGPSVRVPMSHEEWQALGETKHQEWSEGVLYVNPPSRWHVVVATELLMLLRDAIPVGMRVYPDWALHTALGDFEPDLMVAPDDLPDESYVAVPPLLVVEVSSPTTRDLDWDRKLRAYGEAAVEWYWIVDREALTIFENAAGRFVEIQRIPVGQLVETAGPVSLHLDPGRLARR